MLLRCACHASHCLFASQWGCSGCKSTQVSSSRFIIHIFFTRGSTFLHNIFCVKSVTTSKTAANNLDSADSAAGGWLKSLNKASTGFLLASVTPAWLPTYHRIMAISIELCHKTSHHFQVQTHLCQSPFQKQINWGWPPGRKGPSYIQPGSLLIGANDR